jgi:hypothetical protein
MRDRQLYAKILGIEAPWRVEAVELDVDGGELTVRVGHHGELWCPECGESTPGVRHARAPVAASGHVPVPDDHSGRGSEDAV